MVTVQFSIGDLPSSLLNDPVRLSKYTKNIEREVYFQFGKKEHKFDWTIGSTITVQIEVESSNEEELTCLMHNMYSAKKVTNGK